MTFSKILSRAIYGLLLLTTLTPLVYQKKLFFPYDSEKGLFFRFLSEIMLGLWLILIVKDSSFRPRKTPIVLALLGFAAVLILVDMLGVNPHLSVFSNFERMAGLIMYVSVIAYGFVLMSVINSSKRWIVFGIALSVVAFIVSVKAIVQTYDAEDMLINSGRAVGTVGNANQLASYLLLGFFVVGILVSEWILPMRKSKSISAIFLLIIAATFWTSYTLCLFKTSARGSLIGLILGVGLMLILILFYSKQRKIKQVSISMLGGFFIVIVGLFYFRENPVIKKSTILYRITHVTGNKGSNSLISRLNNYKIAMDGIKAKPFLGWGQETYHYVYAQYFNPKMYDDAPWYDRVHNVILEWLINGGIVGLLAYLALWGAVLYQLWRNNNNLQSLSVKIILSGFLIAYFIGNLLLFDNLLSLMAFMIVIGFVESNSVQMESKNTAEWSMKTNPQAIIIASIFIIISTFLILRITCLQAYQTNKEIVKSYSAGSLEEVIETYAQAYPKAIIGKQEIAEQLANLAKDVANNPVPETTKKRYFETANNMMFSEVREHQDYARLQILYADILKAQGESSQALKTYEKVQTLAPKRQSNLIELAMLYARNGEFEKANNLLENSFRLDVQNEEPRVYQAIVMAMKGDTTSRNKIINQLTDGGLNKNIALIQNAYAITNNLNNFLVICDKKFTGNINTLQNSYVMWAMTAFKLRNFEQTATAVYNFRRHFADEKNFRDSRDARLIQQSVAKGIDPSFVFEKIE